MLVRSGKSGPCPGATQTGGCVAQELLPNRVDPCVSDPACPRTHGSAKC